MGRSLFIRSAMAIMAAGVSPLGLSAVQAQTPTELEAIEVVGENESPRGPDQGIVAKRSQAASKTDTPLLETPQAISVVTRDQMEAQGAASVSEALRYTPGVLSDPNGYDTRYDWLYVRGFNAFGTSWLDGLILPGDPNGYATPRINSYGLERVEVIKGPASVLYGRSIPGGLVNLVSKRPQTETYREAEIQTNGFGGIQGAVDMTGALTEDGVWSYRLTGLGKNLHTQIDHERDRQFMVAPSLTWSPSVDTSFTVYGFFQRDEPVFMPRFYPARGTLIDNPAGNIPRDVFLGDPGWGNFDRDFYAVGYEFDHRFNATWSVRQNLRYAGADQNMNLVLVNPVFAYPPAGATPTTLNRVTAIADDTLRSMNVDTQAEARFATGALDHTLLMGVDFIHATSDRRFGNNSVGVAPIDYLNPIYGYDFPTSPVTTSADQTQRQIGFYAQDQIRYDRWIGTFGLRYDRSQIETINNIAGTTVKNDDNQLTGRAGLTYLFDNGIAPYVSYSTSFLPLLGSGQSGTPYDPLQARQFEVGVKYEPNGGRGMVALSYFDMNVKNALTPDPANPSFSVQTGEQRIRGVEIEGKYELTSSIDILAAYAYTDGEVTRSNRATDLGRPLIRLPEHQLGLWASYRPSFVEGLSLSAGVRAYSSYLSAYEVTSGPLVAGEIHMPSRTIVDIGAEYDFGAINKDYEGTKLRVNVSNLFDEKYVSHCGNLTGGSCNYGAGRTITAALKYTW